SVHVCLAILDRIVQLRNARDGRRFPGSLPILIKEGKNNSVGPIGTLRFNVETTIALLVDADMTPPERGTEECHNRRIRARSDGRRQPSLNPLHLAPLGQLQQSLYDVCDTRHFSVSMK